MDANIATALLQNPGLTASVLVSLLGNCIFLISILRVRNILLTYSRMMIERSRITADEQITIDDPDIIPFVKDTFALMGELESVLHWITGYILNSPKTGWINKIYTPQIQAVVEAINVELEKAVEEQAVEQPAQVVSTEPGA